MVCIYVHAPNQTCHEDMEPTEEANEDADKHSSNMSGTMRQKCPPLFFSAGVVLEAAWAVHVSGLC